MLIFHLDPNPSAREIFAATVDLLDGVSLEQFSSVSDCLNAASTAKNLTLAFLSVDLPDVTPTTVKEALLTLHPEARCVFLTHSHEHQNPRLDGETTLPLTARADIVEAIAGYHINLPPIPPLFQPGAKLGDYTLLRFVRVEDSKEVYDAIQATTNRQASLYVLRPEGAINPDRLRAFRSLVRARASVSQKNLTVIYDAADSDNHAYFAAEQLSDATLARTDPKAVTEKNLAVIVESAANAGHYLHQNELASQPWTAEDIALDSGTQTVKLANKVLPGTPAPDVENISALGRALTPFVGRGRFPHVVAQMVSGEFDSWENLAKTASDHLNRIRNQSSLTRAESTMLAPKERARRSVMTWTLVAVIIAALAIAIYNTRPKTTKLTVASTMAFFKGGEFTAPDGTKDYRKGFYLDVHETPIGAYAQFLETLQATPSKKFDHPSQPTSKTNHIPKNWDTIYPAARDGKMYQGQKLSLNDPVVFVDFWDAWAYAAWKGRRLPTEAEWELAARAHNQLKFPWAIPNRPVPENANLGADYSPEGTGGKIDGYNYWAPVDGCPKDVTAKGLLNMLGNVEEWTSSLTEDPTFVGQYTSVVRGGNFTSPGNTDLTARKPAVKAEEPLAIRGFRTASDRPPDGN